MLSSSIYSIQLPFLGTMVLEESAAPTLLSLQTPLRELYKTADRGDQTEHRMVISECDILIFKANAALKDKLNVIYSNIDSIVDVQTLKLSVKVEPQPNESTQVAFVPIGKFQLNSPRWSAVDISVNECLREFEGDMIVHRTIEVHLDLS